MDIKQLRYFTAIVEAGSISGAAKRLHISQPPLSIQLKLLEEEFGAALLVRGARQVTLTDAGRLLYKRAQSILSLANSAVREVEDYVQGAAKTLRLGAISSSGMALLEGRIQAFHKTLPNVRIELHEGNTFELLEQLEQNIIELAVIRTPFQREGLVCCYLDPEPMAVAAVEAEKFIEKPPGTVLSVEDISGAPLIYYRRFEELLLQAFARHDRKLQPICVNDDARTTLFWAKAGLGAALIPWTAAGMLGEDKKLALWTLGEKELVTQIAVVYKEGILLSVAAQKFLACFAEKETLSV